MKGVSVLLTILLLVLAQQLAMHLKRAGALPAKERPAAGLTTLTPATAGLTVPSSSVYQL